MTHGPLAKRHWGIALLTGVGLPWLLLMPSDAPHAWLAAAVLSLIGLYVYEDNYVKAGQAPAIS